MDIEEEDNIVYEQTKENYKANNIGVYNEE